MGGETPMRFDKKAIFIRTLRDEYDPEIGGMKPIEIRDEKYCSCRALGVELKNELLSKIDVGAISLVIKGLGKDYDQVEIDGKRYQVLAKEIFRTKTGYMVGEI